MFSGGVNKFGSTSATNCNDHGKFKFGETCEKSHSVISQPRGIGLCEQQLEHTCFQNYHQTNKIIL